MTKNEGKYTKTRLTNASLVGAVSGIAYPLLRRKGNVANGL